MSPSIFSLSFPHIKMKNMMRERKMETEVLSFHRCSLFCLLSPSISGFLHFRPLSCPSSHSSYHPILSSWLYSLSSSFFLIFLSVHCNYDDPLMTTKVHFLSFDLCSSLFDFFSTDLLVRFFLLLPCDETIKHSVRIWSYWHAYRCVPNRNKCDRNGRTSRKGIVSSQFVFPIPGFPNSFPVCHVQVFLSRFDLRRLFSPGPDFLSAFPFPFPPLDFLSLLFQFYFHRTEEIHSSNFSPSPCCFHFQFVFFVHVPQIVQVTGSYYICWLICQLSLSLHLDPDFPIVLHPLPSSLPLSKFDLFLCSRFLHPRKKLKRKNKWELDPIIHQSIDFSGKEINSWGLEKG